jgi:hypothetical protein
MNLTNSYGIDLLTIKDEPEVINPSELAEFLYLFRGANVALEKGVPGDHHHQQKEPSEPEIAEVKKQISRGPSGCVDLTIYTSGSYVS